MATFVLIPGAGGAAWYWHRVVPELEARGHTAIAVDLPAADDDAGLDAYADTVVAAVGGHEDLVVVAQSMGSLSVPLVCERAPVALVVLVNAMVPCAGETGGAWWDATGQAEARAALAAAEGRPVGDDVDPLGDFFSDVPEDVVAAAMAAGEPPQSARPFADPVGPWPDVPTRVLVGRDDRFFPAAFQRRVAEERLGITPEELPGGHLVALSQPAEVARRLDAAWRDVAAPSRRSA